MSQVLREQTGGDGQKYDAEKLPKQVYAAFSQQLLNPHRGTQDNKHHNHIQEQRYLNVKGGVFRTQGKQGGQGTSTCYQREHQRKQRGTSCRTVVILEYVHVQHHLQSHEENDNCASDGERGYVHVKKL